MLSLHSTLPLQAEWNFLDQGPVVWSIRKTSQLGGSKVPLRHFYYRGWLHYCDPSWHFIHSCRIHPVVFFDELLLAEHWWKANLAQSQSCFRIPLSQLSTGVCHMCLITKLVANCCFQSGTFDSWITEIQIDFADVNQKDDLWICLLVMELKSQFIKLRVGKSETSQKRWKHKRYCNPSGYKKLRSWGLQGSYCRLKRLCHIAYLVSRHSFNNPLATTSRLNYFQFMQRRTHLGKILRQINEPWFRLVSDSSNEEHLCEIAETL